MNDVMLELRSGHTHEVGWVNTIQYNTTCIYIALYHNYEVDSKRFHNTHTHTHTHTHSHIHTPALLGCRTAPIVRGSCEKLHTHTQKNTLEVIVT